jgi:stage III sporulation protein AB
MLKLFGALLIFAAGTLAGFYQSSRYMNRPVQIRHLVLALERLQTEISYGGTPLPEALARSGRGIPQPVGALFAEASRRMNEPGSSSAMEIWQDAVAETWKRTAMREPEREILMSVGATLGASGRDDQLKHLRLAVRQLQSEEETARDEQMRYGKMWRSLGIMAGALVVILMY